MLVSLLRFWSGIFVSAFVLLMSGAQAGTLTDETVMVVEDQPLQHVSTIGSGHDPLATSTQGLFEPRQPYGPSGVLSAGDVLASWPSGHSMPWGLGFSLADQMVWVNDNIAGGGTGLNEEFDVDGVLSGRNFTPNFDGSWPGDMAFNTDTGMFWQVNVGGDNCIHEWDPGIPEATGNSICGTGWTDTSQRGLAYNPNAQTFFIGGWNDANIHQIDSAGSVVSSCTMSLGISGLAYHPDEELLFAMLNAASTTIEVIDWSSCSIVDSITVAGEAFPAFSGAGLGIGCDGNLWAANQSDQNIYLIDSGAPASLCGDPAELTLSTTELVFGEVDINGNNTLSVTVSNAAAAGAAELTLSELALSADAEFSLSGGDCAVGSVLPPGDSCLVEVHFDPTTVDTFSGELEIAASDGQSASVALSGEGVQDPAELTLSLELLDFGSLVYGQTSTLPVVLSNSADAGSADLVIGALSGVVSPFLLDAGSCQPLPVTLASGESCELSVQFSSEAPAGVHVGELLIESNDPSSPTVVGLLGQSLPPVAVPVPTLRWPALILMSLLAWLMMTRALSGRLTLRPRF